MYLIPQKDTSNSHYIKTKNVTPSALRYSETILTLCLTSNTTFILCYATTPLLIYVLH